MAAPRLRCSMRAFVLSALPLAAAMVLPIDIRSDSEAPEELILEDLSPATTLESRPDPATVVDSQPLVVPPGDTSQFEIKASRIFDNDNGTSGHQEYSSTEADESAVLVTGGSDTVLSWTVVEKSGNGSDFNATVWDGVNAAVRVLNDSTLHMDHSKILAEKVNSTALLYAVGSDTEAYVTLCQLLDVANEDRYSVGVIASDGADVILHEADVNASFPFIVADGARLDVSDSTAIAARIEGHQVPIFTAWQRRQSTDGSAKPVLEVSGSGGKSESGFIYAGFGSANATFSKCDLAGGSSAAFQLNAWQPDAYWPTLPQNLEVSGEDRLQALTLLDSTIKLQDENATAFLVGTDSDADITISNTEFDPNPTHLVVIFVPDIAMPSTPNDRARTISVHESKVGGDIMGPFASPLELRLMSHSEWTGQLCAWGDTTVVIDDDSKWILTASSSIRTLLSSKPDLSNIDSQGFNVSYDALASGNKYLEEKEVPLQGGGWATPRYPKPCNVQCANACSDHTDSLVPGEARSGDGLVGGGSAGLDESADDYVEESRSGLDSGAEEKEDGDNSK